MPNDPASVSKYHGMASLQAKSDTTICWRRLGNGSDSWRCWPSWSSLVLWPMKGTALWLGVLGVIDIIGLAAVFNETRGAASSDSRSSRHLCRRRRSRRAYWPSRQWSWRWLISSGHRSVIAQ